MSRHLHPALLSLSLLVLLPGDAGARPPLTVAPLSPAEAAAEGIPTAEGDVHGLKIHDRAGEHRLVLTRVASATTAGSVDGRTDLIQLRATSYRRAKGGWSPEWVIRDEIQCPGLDIAAAFFTDQLTVTDLDGDGHYEATVPYRLFCGGGVDSSVIKVILRSGEKKLAIRGESRIKSGPNEWYGGSHQLDKALDAKENRVFKQHLLKVWQRVYIEQPGD
ncbi:M949_RS01915 family surface polysaccharide biosynthesis protein [Eleftheria terrae]|uniref:M949_RS01915 family surface polysaccharide biosynthesis protein n=1 Tax=Eleftheria terrae TaxID=1597781 RepID=UPI00263BC633|nr:hypothetical protein [Eleftheria terrae]WKB54793.1 hypothetical protein N7L95_10585 [Eleftheria terrae]